MTDILLNELFGQAKDRLDIRETAQHYGLDINRHGKACCPFHNDKHPSLSFKGQFFKCFSCGVGGDVFKLVGQLTGVSKPIDVLKMLNADFCLGLDLDRKQDRRELMAAQDRLKQRERQRALQQAFDDWLRNALITCTSYAKLLRDWRLQYAPKAEGEPFHPLFEESLSQLTRTEYLCYCLTYGLKQEQQEFYKNCRKEVEAIEQRIKHIREYNTGSEHTQQRAG